MTYKVYICGPTDCPTDPAFEHDNYFGCIPKNFSATTGRSKTHRQSKGPDDRYYWNGGCDIARRDLLVGEARPGRQEDGRDG